MKPTLFSFALLAVIINSCAVSTGLVAPEGRIVRMQTKEGSLLEGNLVEIDSAFTLFWETRNAEGGRSDALKQVFYTSLSNVKTLKIIDPTPGWVWGLLGFVVAPTVTFLVTLHSNTKASPSADLILAVPALAIWGLYEATDPPPIQFEGPFNSTKVDSLRQYARFPQGLTSEQRTSMLSLYKLKSIKESK